MSVDLVTTVRLVRCPDCGHPLMLYPPMTVVRKHSNIDWEPCPRREIPAGTPRIVPGPKAGALTQAWNRERRRRQAERKAARG